MENLDSNLIELNRTIYLVALIEACRKGPLSKVEKLLEQGVPINWQDKDGHTPLLAAAYEGASVILSFLIDKGANVQVTDHEGRTALMMAVKADSLRKVEILLSEGAQVNVKDKKGMTALMYAASFGRKEMVEMLLRNMAEVNTSDNEGLTPLMYATKSVYMAEKFTEILETFAPILGKQDKEPPKEDASVENVELLLKRRAKIDSQDNEGRTALMYAVMNNSVAKAALLVKMGADPKLKDRSGKVAAKYIIPQYKKVFRPYL